jgi:DNA polymerase I
VDEAFKLQAIFNEALKVWATENHSSVAPTIKFEKFYRRILFKKSSGKEGAAKKRYAGHLSWKGGQEVSKISYTGIEIKRSDQAKITKDVLTAFLTKCLLDDDLDGACRVVREAFNNTRLGRASPYDVSIPRGLKDREGNNPWARGVKNTEAILGGLFPQGVKPRLIYSFDPTEVCIWDDTDISALTKQIRIDWYTIADKTIKDKMLSFVESIGYDWDKVVNNQASLGNWIGEDLPYKALPRGKKFKLQRGKK